jgi:hypothetical protein
MRHLVREVVYFVILFGVLALGMHMDRWLSTPLAHWEGLSYHVMPWHPLVYTFGIYLALGAIRVVFHLATLPFRRRA